MSLSRGWEFAATSEKKRRRIVYIKFAGSRLNKRNASSWPASLDNRLANEKKIKTVKNLNHELTSKPTQPNMMPQKAAIAVWYKKWCKIIMVMTAMTKLAKTLKSTTS